MKVPKGFFKIGMIFHDAQRDIELGREVNGEKLELYDAFQLRLIDAWKLGKLTFGSEDADEVDFGDMLAGGLGHCGGQT